MPTLKDESDTLTNYRISQLEKDLKEILRSTSMTHEIVMRLSLTEEGKNKRLDQVEADVHALKRADSERKGQLSVIRVVGAAAFAALSTAFGYLLQHIKFP